LAKIWFTSGLNFSLVFKSYPTKFFNSVLNPDGRGLYAPLTIFIAKKCKLGASKGGFYATNSYRTTPRDQISDLKL